MEIPNIIHQIWFQGDDQIPLKLKKFQQTWKRNHPHWEYKLWDEQQMSDFIRGKYAQHWIMYDKFPYMHQKIDFFKYLILYDQGGFYTDMDTKSLKPVDEILQKYPNAQVILGYTNASPLENYMAAGVKQMINNGILMAKPGHPMLRTLLGSLQDQPNTDCRFYLTKYQCINNTTGPYNFNLICQKFRHDPTVKILPGKYLEPCFSADSTCRPGPEAYVDHQHEQTWVPKWLLGFVQMYYKVKNNTHLQILTLLVLAGLIALVYYFFYRK